jgi:hypothetical protein
MSKCRGPASETLPDSRRSPRWAATGKLGKDRRRRLAWRVHAKWWGFVGGVFLEREAGDFNNAMGARSGGARSPDRGRAHRRAVPSGPPSLRSDLNAAGEATGRISGFVMICLAAGGCPRAGESERHQALFPLVALSWLVAAFLLVTGLIDANVGLLLWPAAALHLILAVLLTWTWASAPATS